MLSDTDTNPNPNPCNVILLNQHLVSRGRFNTAAWNISVITDDVIAILLDLLIDIKCITDVIQWHDYIINTTINTALDIVCRITSLTMDPHATVMSHISPVSAISNQIDLQFTHDVSHMVTWALYYIIQHSHHTAWHASHNRPRIPQESINDYISPAMPYLFK